MRDESTIRLRGPLAYIVSLAIVVVACTNGSAPGGTGDRLVVDTKPAPTGTGTGTPPDGDSGFPTYDAAHAPDGYAPFDACQKCACSSNQFCLGGVTGETSIASCPVGDAGAMVKTGCNELPPACAASPTCACILDALHRQFPCYPVCSNLIGGFTVYCPIP